MLPIFVFKQEVNSIEVHVLFSWYVLNMIRPLVNGSRGPDQRLILALLAKHLHCIACLVIIPHVQLKGLFLHPGTVCREAQIMASPVNQPCRFRHICGLIS